MGEDLHDKYKEKTVDFKQGDIIFREKEESTDLYIVISGQVIIYLERLGKIIPLSVVNSGIVFGEFSFFDELPRSATAAAATDTKLVKIQREAKLKDLAKLPAWLKPVIHTIIERLRTTNDLLKRNNVVDERLSDQFQRLDFIKKLK